MSQTKIGKGSIDKSYYLKRSLKSIKHTREKRKHKLLESGTITINLKISKGK